VPDHMDGRSFLGLASGQADASEWRQSLVYEYYWEWNFPHTPTVFALREDRFKLIQYHGIWDSDELYDLIEDPLEQHNLIREAEYRDVIARMREDLYNQLVAAGANRIPFGFKRGDGANRRSVLGSRAAPFPDYVKR